MNTLNINPTLLKATVLSATILPVVGLAGNKDNSKNDRPNIVVIVADDLLSSELSCYGGQNLVTRNIDKLASEGVRFTQNYASMSMSVPVRASMYTGLYPMHHGSYQNHKKTNPGTKTAIEYMTEEGYRVGRTGKDHPVNPAVYKFEKIPGFTVGCTAQKAPFTVDGIREFITRNDDPFLLYVCSIHPHAPWTWGDPGEFNKDKLVMPENCVDNPDMREIFTKYLAEVRALDNEVGAVVEVLTDAKKLDNTIVIFLGEQGPQFPGGKWTCWYPGVNSALIARYPSEISAGSVSKALVQYEDLLPTFIDIAGGKSRKELDGVSFRKALYGKTDKARKYAYGLHNNFPEGPPYPIRSIRDQKYALIWNLTPDKNYYEKHLMKTSDNITGVWPAWKSSEATDPKAAFLINRFVHRPEFEFYDVEKDPWEMVNLVDQPEHQSRIKEMKRELKKWMDEQGDSGAAVDVKF